MIVHSGDLVLRSPQTRPGRVCILKPSVKVQIIVYGRVFNYARIRGFEDLRLFLTGFLRGFQGFLNKGKGAVFTVLGLILAKIDQDRPKISGEIVVLTSEIKSLVYSMGAVLQGLRAVKISCGGGCPKMDCGNAQGPDEEW